MIASFRHKGLRRFFETGDTRGINAEHASRILAILTVRDVAQDLTELALPTYHPHDLSGDLRGFKAVTVRANWRIIFRYRNGEAADVDLQGYHQEHQMPMKYPAHPGQIIRSELDALEVSVAAAARALGVTRQQLYNVISGKSRVTAEMAVRLEKGLGSTADMWLQLQANHDLAQVRNEGDLRVEPLVPKIAAE